MASPDPIVTVAVSTHASERFIGACMEMLVGQSLGDAVEVIVVDSGSPEDEGAVVEPFLASGRVRYLRTGRETLYAAWNRALSLARGRYFTNVNVDDWITPHALEVLAAALDHFPDCALAYADWASTDAPNSPPAEGDLVAHHTVWEPMLHLAYCYSGCVQFWRRSSLEELGGFDASFRAAGDLDALRRLADAGMRPVYVPEVLVGFHRNPEGLSLGSDLSVREQSVIRERTRAAIRLEELYDIDPSDRRALADAWTTLGVFAMRARVPWHDHALGDVGFALSCFDRALQFEPHHLDALHDRYAVLFENGRRAEADRSLEGLPIGVAIAARGADLALRHAPVPPKRRGELFIPSEHGR